MNKKMMYTVMISFLLALISFFVAFQSNVFTDAVLRSLIVLVVAFLILNLFISVVRTISTPNAVQEEDQGSENNQTEDHQQQITSKAASQNEESFKGGYINLQTPDEDHFHPLKPEELNKHDD